MCKKVKWAPAPFPGQTKRKMLWYDVIAHDKKVGVKVSYVSEMILDEKEN